MLDSTLKKIMAFLICYCVEFNIQADPLNKENIEKIIFAHALQSSNMGNFRIQLDTWPSNWNSLDNDEIIVKSFKKINNTQRFLAEIQHGKTSKKVYGVIIEQVPLPVLKITSSGGTEITKEMISIENFDQRFVDGQTVTSADYLLGQKIKMQRSLKANKPISSNDLERNEIIKKDDVVTIDWKYSNLTISIPAKALKSGAKGDIIPFEVSSKKRIKARIINENQALSGSHT
ncbi:MAG: flagella basal body P-ring formation protein FlgA [Candidatus Puniceispirillum sp.]|nr:flagella basal body P-ring formation protein FlgA [Candidatus Pelagibacter sp.]MBA4282929.1 flagella basal body P-ring formation protein FlgA [Candidatus Puniceispirillum sp.]